MPLTQLLEAAWAAGVDTWSGTARFGTSWIWIAALVNVTNARVNGWKIPSPW